MLVYSYYPHKYILTHNQNCKFVPKCGWCQEPKLPCVNIMQVVCVCVFRPDSIDLLFLRPSCTFIIIKSQEKSEK